MLNNIANICMVTFNRLDFTKRSIQSIIDVTPKNTYTLSVVDNGSTDGTVEYLKELKKDGTLLNLLLLPNNIGSAKASNILWQIVDDIYFVKCDNDIIINSETWINDMITITDNISEIGAVCHNVNRWSDLKLKKYGNIEVRITPWNQFTGGCTLIPKRTKNEIGYFCEDFGIYGEVDVDYAYRINKIDKIVVSMPDMNSAHHLQKREKEPEEYIKYKKDQIKISSPIMHSNLREYDKDIKNIFKKPKVELKDVQKYIWNEQ